MTCFTQWTLLIGLILLPTLVRTKPADFTKNPRIFAHDPTDDIWALHKSNVKKFEYLTWSAVRIHPTANPQQPLYKRSLRKRHVPHHSDAFLLEFDAYDATFCIHLFPSEELFHVNATYRRVTAAGEELVTDDPLLPDEVPAYRGYVVSVLNHTESVGEDGVTIDDEDYECEWPADGRTPNYDSYDPGMDWARFVVRNGDFQTASKRKRDLRGIAPLFEGTFIYNDDVYIVSKAENYELHQRPDDAQVVPSYERDEGQQDAQLVVYRTSDFEIKRTSLTKRSAEEPHACGFNQLDWNVNGGAEEYMRRKMKEAPVEMSFQSPASSYLTLKKRSVAPGCPTSKKVLYMGVVMDCTYISLFRSEAEARARVISNWNTVSQIYNQFFNTYIGLLQIISMPNCGNEMFNQQCSNSYTINARLSDFSQWRGKNQDSSAGLWHLMSKCKTDPTIGIAWMNMLCQTSSFSQNINGVAQFVSGCAISTSQNTPSDIEWMVIAHEIGHNFGASHDCTANLCVGCNTNPCAQCCPCAGTCDCYSQYLMNPTNDVNPLNPKFSPCSQADVCSKNKLFGTCLEDPGARTVLNGGICGNGVIEGNEECDCGGAETCLKSPCCFANCTLKAGAICDDFSHTCCRNCSVIPASEKRQCRGSVGECDVSEYCLGDKMCPKDTFRPDGLTCSNSTSLKCATGACTSRDQQCLSFGRTDITGNCDLFSGQCGMYCRQEMGGCTKVAVAFRDGTPCGNNGFCYGGICSNPDILGLIIQWVSQNQNIAITLFSVGGILLFIGISKCVRRVRSTDKRAELVRQAKLEASELARLEKIQKALKERRLKEAEAMARRGLAPGAPGTNFDNNGKFQGPPGSGIASSARL